MFIFVLACCFFFKQLPHEKFKGVSMNSTRFAGKGDNSFFIYLHHSQSSYLTRRAIFDLRPWRRLWL